MGVKVGSRESLEGLIYTEGALIAVAFLAEVWFRPFGIEGPIRELLDEVLNLHEAIQLGLGFLIFIAFVGFMLYVPAVFWGVALGMAVVVGYFTHMFVLEVTQDQIWAVAGAVVSGLIVLFWHWRARGDAHAPAVDILRDP